MTIELFFTALGWTMNGWGVLPCQPGKKSLVPGFGPHKGVIHKPNDVGFWFRERSANIAVVCPDDCFILDFDDLELYALFCEKRPEVAASYTEFTPRGGAHVFIKSDCPKSVFSPLPGLEVKRVALVHPSIVEGLSYTIVEGQGLLKVDLRTALDGFCTIEPIKSRPEAVAASAGLPVANLGGNFGRLAKAKQKWPILDYFTFFEPKLVLTGRGRWRSGLCPWHSDKRPSLWVDTVRGLWGCHGCKASGDVVNWHKRRKGFISMAAAIYDLNQYVEGGDL